MKWLFIIVALLNIAYGAYNLFIAEDVKFKSTDIGSTDKTQIVQLNELDATTLKRLQDKALPSKEIIDEIKSSKSLDKTSEKESIVDNVEDDLPQPTLNSEENLCYKLGPFTKDVMNEVRVLLDAEYKNQLSFGIETTSDITYYRIYIPPIQNKAQIKETLSILDKNGLKDHYVMSIDGRKNAIALGVFKERSAAEKVANTAANIGLSTTIEAISDDKNSLYQLMVIFQKGQETSRYQEIILEKQLISTQCDNKG